MKGTIMYMVVVGGLLKREDGREGKEERSVSSDILEYCILTKYVSIYRALLRHRERMFACLRNHSFSHSLAHDFVEDWWDQDLMGLPGRLETQGRVSVWVQRQFAAEFPFAQRSVFVLFKLLMDWMSSVHITEGNLLYSESMLNIIQTSTWNHPEWSWSTYLSPAKLTHNHHTNIRRNTQQRKWLTLFTAFHHLKLFP